MNKLSDVFKPRLNIRWENVVECMAAACFVMLIVMKISIDIKNVLSIVEVVIGLIILLYYALNRGLNYRLLIFVTLACIAVFLNWLFVSSIQYNEIIKLFFVHFPIALVIAYNRNMMPRLWLACFIFLFFFLLYRLNLYGNHIFWDTNSNSISVDLIICAFIYELALKKRGKNTGVFIPLLVFIASTIAGGRGGIISSSILLLFYLINKYRTDKRNVKMVIKTLVSIFGLTITAIFLSENIYMILQRFFPRFTSIQAANTSHSNFIRLSLVKSYIYNCKDIMGFFMGVDIAKHSQYGAALNGNIHNSYLQLHSYLGLIGIALVAYVFFVYFRTICKSKQNLIVISFFLAFFVRILTDYALPGNIGDIIVWYVVITVADRFKHSIESVETCVYT